jgi:acyl-CoA thioester hydrolase
MSLKTTVRVRFCETDALGHVNNVSYFIYMEQARVDFLKGMGFDFTEQDRFVALVSAKCEYINQAFFDQEIEIETYVEKVGGKSLTLNQDLIDKKTKNLIAKGQAVCVFLSKDKTKALPIDSEWRTELMKMAKEEIPSF